MGFSPVKPKEYQSGSKPRFDGSGSLFGDLHRELASGITMFDIDTLLIRNHYDFLNTENSLYCEYGQANGEIYFTAIFEIKYRYTEATKNNVFDLSISANRALLKLAKMIKSRLFLIIENSGEKPLDFYEIDKDGKSLFVYKLDWQSNTDRAEKVMLCWKSLGLIK